MLCWLMRTKIIIFLLFIFASFSSFSSFNPFCSEDKSVCRKLFSYTAQGVGESCREATEEAMNNLEDYKPDYLCHYQLYQANSDREILRRFARCEELKEGKYLSKVSCRTREIKQRRKRRGPACVIIADLIVCH